jgi:hypothetical protein
MKQQISDRLAQNLDRVRNLVKVYEALAGAGKGRRPVHSTDVLRAATVLLHAALEDFLRSLDNWKLPLAQEATLNEASLAGMTGRPANFLLGKLVQFRGKTIDEVIAESVSDHLNRKSYNSVGEVAKSLTRIGVMFPNLPQYSRDLAALIERRHRIVHQADKETGRGTGHHQATSLSKQRVEAWIGAVQGASSDILNNA